MQPVNSVSSLGFVVVGAVVAYIAPRRSGAEAILARSFGFGLALVGVGSLAFHGTEGLTAGWIHDASIAALVLLVLIVEFGHRVGWSSRQMVIGWAVAAPALMLVEGIWAQLGDSLNASLALLAVLGVLESIWKGRYRTATKGVLAGMGVLAVGAIVMLLSRTGGPICVPDSLIQGHALWHLMAASGLGMYGSSIGATLIRHLDARAPL